MCLIIHRDDDTKIAPSLLAQGITDNPDGWGIMTAANGKIHTIRSMDEKEFFPTLDLLNGLPLTIHFRYATHGSKGVDNCHPFDILDGAYSVMHNGVIDVPLADKDRSDTYHFAHHVLAPILAHDPAAFGSAYLGKLLGSIIGYGSKLVILRADGESMIVNEAAGCWHDGLWLSNRHSLPIAHKPLLTTANKYRLSAWRDEELDGWDTRDRDYRDRDINDWPEQDDTQQFALASSRKSDPADFVMASFDLAEYAGMSWEEINDAIRDDPDGVTTAIWAYFNEDDDAEEIPVIEDTESELVEITDIDDTERDAFDAR